MHIWEKIEGGVGRGEITIHMAKNRSTAPIHSVIRVHCPHLPAGFYEKGFIILDTEREMYMVRAPASHLWDTDKFSVISGGDIDTIQDLLLGREPKETATGEAIAFFYMIRDMFDTILVVPCIKQGGKDEVVTFDYVKAFKFAGLSK